MSESNSKLLERNQSNRAFEKCLRGGFFLRKKPLCRIALGYSYSGFAIGRIDVELNQQSNAALGGRGTLRRPREQFLNGQGFFD
jgi:hypothetical protein